MHLLYTDESGSIGDPNQRYFVLAGISVFERKCHWIEQDLNKIAARFQPQSPHEIELHGSPMRTGRDGWDRFPQADRRQAILDALGIAKRCCPRSARLFGVALEKQGMAGQDVAQVAFEQLSSRFDQYLGRLHRKHGDSQRGLVLFDKSATERRIQTLAREFRYTGHCLGQGNAAK